MTEAVSQFDKSTRKSSGGLHLKMKAVAYKWLISLVWLKAYKIESSNPALENFLLPSKAACQSWLDDDGSQ